jgi:hypothetical protein
MWRENGKKFGGDEAGGWNAEIGRDFGERYEDEGALSEPRVRDFEAGLCKHETAREKDVEIEGAGAVGDGGGAVAAEEALDGEKRVKERARRKIGFKGNDGVKEARLIGEAHGLGGVERGTRGDAAKFCDWLKGGGERGIGRASGAGKVCAECDIGEGHADLRVAEPAEFPAPPKQSLNGAPNSTWLIW